MKTYTKILLGSVIGNVTEWYEFAIYGFSAPIIASLFFPSSNPKLSILAAFGAFAIGFLVRPIGALIFGHMGDTLGREKALLLSIISMGITTFLMGLLPTYHEVGIFAPLLIILIRLLQGVCIGGEFGGSLTYLVENSESSRRGVAAGVIVGSAFLGMLLASGIGALVVTLLDKSQVVAWGWRIPFLLGVIIALIGLFLRRSLPTSMSFQKIIEKREISRNPLLESFTIQIMNILKVIGLSWLSSIIIYLLFIFMPSYAATYLNVPVFKSLMSNTIGMFVLLASCVFSGKLSDRYGRKPLLLISTLALLVIVYPLYYFISKHPDLLPVSQVILGLVGGVFIGPSMATWPELFPTNIRYSAVSIGYNIGFAIFGGTAPLIASYLIVLTNHLVAPAYYVIAVCLFTLCLLPRLNETAFLDVT